AVGVEGADPGGSIAIRDGSRLAAEGDRGRQTAAPDVDQGDGFAGAFGPIGDHPQVAPADRLGAGPRQWDLDALGAQDRLLVKTGTVDDAADPRDDRSSAGDPGVAFRIDRDVVE